MTVRISIPGRESGSGWSLEEIRKAADAVRAIASGSQHAAEWSVPFGFRSWMEECHCDVSVEVTGIQAAEDSMVSRAWTLCGFAVRETSLRCDELVLEASI